MPRTIDGVEAWARDDAHDRRDGGSWAGWCESFVWRAGGFDGSFESAQAAGDASGPLDTDWRTAQRGEIHYWSGVGGNGHVAFELGGGLLLMASSAVTDRWGVDLGTVPFRTYALKGIPYRGHTYRHGNQRLATSALAGAIERIIMGYVKDNTTEDKEWLAWDILNKKSFVNMNDDKISLAEFLNAVETRQVAMETRQIRIEQKLDRLSLGGVDVDAVKAAAEAGAKAGVTAAKIPTAEQNGAAARAAIVAPAKS